MKLLNHFFYTEKMVIYRTFKKKKMENNEKTLHDHYETRDKTNMFLVPFRSRKSLPKSLGYTIASHDLDIST